MSFTADVKEELSHVPPTCSHCERATLAALVRMDGTLMLAGAGRYRLETNTDSPAAARLMLQLLHGLYDLRTETVMRRSVLHKTPNYLINVPMQPGLDAVLRDLGVVSEAGIEQGVRPELVSKRCCAAAYMRGAFLGRGFVSDPHGDFHFEITASSEQLVFDMQAILAEAGIQAHVMQRRNDHILYLKSGNAISEFLAFVGAHNSALAMESERVVKSVRNDTNRRVNAEMANQRKAVDASIDQIAAMQRVIDHGGMDELSPALRQIVRLRVNNPDATLKELGELSDPPLSKSAVYHRIRRIEQMARGLDASRR